MNIGHVYIYPYLNQTAMFITVTAIDAIMCWFIGIGCCKPRCSVQMKQYPIMVQVMVAYVNPITKRQVCHLFSKVKFVHNSAWCRIWHTITGMPEYILVRISSYQRDGCCKTLGIGTKQKKIPTKQATNGPLKMEKQYKKDVSLASSDEQLMNIN